jgi:probable rRNA maturation factor
MPVEVNNKTKSRVDIKVVRKIAEKFLRRYKLSGKTVSIAIVGDSAMRRLNRRFKGEDRATDVFAFPGERDFLGEIVIDYGQIKRQAPRYAGSAEKEMAFVLVHGLLHLRGLDDRTGPERKKMEKLGHEFIKSARLG